MKKLLFIIPALVLITSCNVARLQKDVHLARYDASKRGTLIFKDESSNQIKTISEVQPDVAISSVLELSSKIEDGKGLTAEQVMSLTKTVAQLGERTEAVNILRDALHRLSEIKINNGTIDTETKDIFESVLSTVGSIILTDKAKADTKLAEAETEKAYAQKQKIIAEKELMLQKNKLKN